MLNELNYGNIILYSWVQNENKLFYCYFYMNFEYYEIEECMELNGILLFVSVLYGFGG